jgi:hypothetical protein
MGGNTEMILTNIGYEHMVQVILAQNKVRCLAIVITAIQFRNPLIRKAVDGFQE